MFDSQLYSISIPMLRKFGHAKADRDVAESVIFLVRAHGIEGIGECVPREYVTGETISSVLSAISSLNINDLMRGVDLTSPKSAISSLEKLSFNQLPLNAKCAVELALLDFIGKYFSFPINFMLQSFLLPNGLKRNSLLTKIPTSQVLDFSLTVKDFIESRAPFHHVKVKLGADINKNLNCLDKLRQDLGPHIRFTVDANMGWDLDLAFKMINAFDEFDIEYYEEPIAKKNWRAYAEIRKKTGAKILLDESVCTFQDAQSAIENKACDAINIRISKCGGLLSSIKLAELAKINNLSYQLGAQVAETGPLIAAGRHLASALNGWFTFEGGQPDRFFPNHYIIDPMPLVNRSTNLASVSALPGLGVMATSCLSKCVKKQMC